ncbi:MAG: hypothetical protein SPG61_01760 [Arcanobacterium sp.]|nr:hypothetical protein [Arcanobacterium sp.]
MMSSGKILQSLQIVLHIVACSGLVFGAYVTFLHDGVVIALIPFLLIGLLGAVVASYGILKSKNGLVSLGSAMLIFCPTGFFYLSNIAAFLGAVLSGVNLLLSEAGKREF